MFRQALAPVVILLPFALATPAFGAGGSAGAPAATPTRIMAFNLTPAGAYEVRRNGALNGTSLASPSGAVVIEASANPGDRFELRLTGLDPVSPSRPTGFRAAGNTEGCVVVSWNPPPPTDYVTDYSLLWGAQAGSYTDSTRIDGIDIAKGTAWVSGHCGLASGTYVFSIRAHNSFDRWSAPAVPVSATIGNQDTQGPLPPTNVKVSESSFGCAALTWTQSSDATVTGYRVFFGSRPRSQAAYTDSMDAASATTALRCGLAEGNYYFSVRARTATGTMSAWSKEVLLSARGSDILPPSISNRSPAPGATNVARNVGVFFVASDDKTGVDPGSISVTLDGVELDVTTSPTVGGLAVQCAPAGVLPPETEVEVELSVADRASPANVATRSYTFRTGSAAATDDEAPLVSAVSPAPDASGVEARPTIEVRVRDAGLGVDLAGLVMEVNGEAVSFTVEGTPADARIRYRPASGFPPQSSVDVHVEACDGASSPNCSVLDFHFDVGAASASTSGRGAIVPDGFWANDPARPLEIRDIPENWSVRIFDASGSAVRRHQNSAEGATWTWNFNNDEGLRVAPALYLVRVTDSNGVVQRSGRFLVQSRQ